MRCPVSNVTFVTRKATWPPTAQRGRARERARTIRARAKDSLAKAAKATKGQPKEWRMAQKEDAGIAGATTMPKAARECPQEAQ